jgi:hypothetical protein
LHFQVFAPFLAKKGAKTSDLLAALAVCRVKNRLIGDFMCEAQQTASLPPGIRRINYCPLFAARIIL